MTNIDMHNHTVFSPDSTATPEESVEKAIEAGLDGIAFTEHQSFTDQGRVEMLRRRYRDRIMVFSGAEYTAAEGHVLLFGIKEDDLRQFGLHLPVIEIVRLVNERNGAVVVPHPFREWLLFQAEIGIIGGISAIEACNGHTSRDDNHRAMSAARALGLPTTGGSDSHSKDEVGRCYTEFDTDVNYANFIETLKKGGYRGVYGKGY